jgi:hypothetical protein
MIKTTASKVLKISKKEFIDKGYKIDDYWVSYLIFATAGTIKQDHK